MAKLYKAGQQNFESFEHFKADSEKLLKKLYGEFEHFEHSVEEDLAYVTKAFKKGEAASAPADIAAGSATKPIVVAPPTGELITPPVTTPAAAPVLPAADTVVVPVTDAPADLSTPPVDTPVTPPADGTPPAEQPTVGTITDIPATAPAIDADKVTDATTSVNA